MCGIFGFALAKPIPLSEVFKVLERLEVHQYPNEETSVGGYGAGIATLQNGRIVVEKVGKTGDSSPVSELTKHVKTGEMRVLVSHVRMPSPQFMQTAHLCETAQPYAASCIKTLSVASAHNGYIQNYQMLREKLDKTHTLESDSVGLIDSEVVPHCFEEVLRVNGDVEEALHALYAMLEGRMTVALLQIGGKVGYLHFLHKGKTRGLHIWTNGHGEVFFISRKETLTPYFEGLLDECGLSETVTIAWREEKNLKLSFALRS